MDINQEYIHEVQKILGSWIHEIRKERGLTQEQLGELVGCEKQTIYKIEIGKWLSIPMLIKLSVALDFYPFFLEKESEDELAVMMRERWRRAHDKN